MDVQKSPLLSALFKTRASRVLLRADSPRFTIVKANDTYLRETLTAGKGIEGKGLFEVFDPAKSSGNEDSLLRTALDKAIADREVVNLPPFQYNLSDETQTDYIPNFWDAEILPIEVAGGLVGYLLVTTNNVTTQVQNAHSVERSAYREDQLAEELASTNEELEAANLDLIAAVGNLQATRDELKLLNEDLQSRITARIAELAKTATSLRSLVMNAHYPLMILRGREWVIEIANQPLVNLWDKTIEAVIGKRLMDVLPEIEDQPFPGFLRQVYDTGVGYGEKEQIFYLNATAGPATKYVSFYYDPLKDDDGIVRGIIVSAEDITANVHSRKLLQQSYEDQQALNEEVTAVNEELAATIEELSSANEELYASKASLEEKNIALVESESRFRNLVREAPVAICVIRASDLMIQEVNDQYLDLVGKRRNEFADRTIWEAVPEAAAAYAPVLKEVVDSGKAFIAKEHELTLIRHGVSHDLIIDFVYEPVKDSRNIVTAIMVVGIDVTEKVVARKKIEDVEERIRLAVDASGIGTFEFNYQEATVVSSERFNAIFGIKELVTRDEVLAVYHPDDKHLSGEAHEAAKRSGKMLYEARIIRDGETKWIRVQGNLYTSATGEPVKLLGTVLDITEFKRLQQQKDDFISIASHELKTPITSLKASLQLLDRLKDRPDTSMLPKLIEQSGKSMNKITDLVEDLLNVSRMNAGQIQLRKRWFSVGKMLEESCNNILTGTSQAFKLTGDLEEMVFADDHRIDQVVVNFVNNAVKHAPDSEEIIINALKVGETIKVSVTDHGPGIVPEKLPHLFERYYQADNTGNQFSGLGLGLYIAADLIQRHGGRIGVDSEEGNGSTFWFTLPIDGGTEIQ